MESNMQGYLKFVEREIEKFQENTSLISDDHLTPRVINKALAEYGTNSAMLISEYQRAKIGHYEIQSEFADWWDRVVNEAREDVLENVEGKKYPAYKEYELVAKQNNAQQYRDYQNQIAVAERKISFLRRLLETWKKQDQILVTLAHNMRAELKALSLEDRTNSDKGDTTRKRRVKGASGETD